MLEREDGPTAEDAENAETVRRLKNITELVIGAAIQVHRDLGPGLLESTYEACLVHELLQRGLFVETQKHFPVVYHGRTIPCGYRVDIFVEGEVIVELKAVNALRPIDEAQLLTYLKLANCRVGLLINFNVGKLQAGIKRMVNGLPD